MNEAIFNNDGKLVGHVEDRNGGRWFVKGGLVYKTHHLHRYDSWATDVEHVDMMIERQLDGVILELVDGRVFWSLRPDWVKHGFVKNLGYGDQTLLKDTFWKQGTPGVSVPAEQIAMSLEVAG